MSLFDGSGVAIVTPFTEDNEVNFEKLGELIEFQIENDTDAIIVCGTTGEAPTLADNEHQEVIKYTVNKVDGRVPVIAGTGSNNTHHAIEMSQYAEQVGADGLLLVTPYYNKSTQRGLIQHYTAIADAVHIPIILYNVPSRTGVNIDPATVYELSKHENIQAVKEASGNISQVVEIARLVDKDFKIYSGNDDMIVPLMSVRGNGVISVLANILPKETHDLVQYYLDGEHDKAADMQLKYKGLIDAIFCEVNPIPIKTALNIMGYEVGDVRLPLYKMEQKNADYLINEMKLVDVI